jgi:hypothetical protein
MFAVTRPFLLTTSELSLKFTVPSIVPSTIKSSSPATSPWIMIDGPMDAGFLVEATGALGSAVADFAVVVSFFYGIR